MAKGVAGRTLAYVDGHWRQGNPLLMGPRHHAVWLASVVFDGARYFQGVAPDLDLHCARAVRSAYALGMAPMLTGAEIADIAWEGIHRFPAEAELYVCPMFYAESGFVWPEPASTRFVLTVHEAALPAPTGFSACLSSFRRPARDMAPTEAKASCLYPNIARIGREAAGKGFDTAVVLDPCNNVAEFAYTNLFLVRDGVVHTPAINGTFLNGITRQRVIQLLRADGIDVVERAIRYDEVLTADELFATGNYAKVQPCTRIEARVLKEGPVYRRARELYLAFARKGAR